MRIVIHCLSVLIGIVLLICSVMLYEDEQRGGDEWLQMFWIQLDDKSKSAVAQFGAIMQRVAGLSNKVLDRLLGEKLFSLQMITVSSCLSSVSFVLLLPLAFPNKQGEPPISLKIWVPSLVAPLIYGVLPAIFRKRWAVWIPSIALFLGIAVCAVIGVVISRQQGSWMNFANMFFLADILSVSSIIIVVVIDRSVLRWSARKPSLFTTVVLILINALLLLMVVGPMTLLSENGFPEQLSNGWLVFPLMTLGVMSLSNLFPALLSLVFFLVGLSLFLYRLIWPAVKRPIYALTQYKVFQHPGWLATAGLGLVGLGLGDSIWLRSAAHVVGIK